MNKEITECADCHAPVKSLLELMAHWEEGCPATTIEFVIAVTKTGDIWSLPEFTPSELIPDLPALLRYMADCVTP